MQVIARHDKAQTFLSIFTQLKTFKFSKAVFKTAIDKINAVSHNKPLDIYRDHVGAYHDKAFDFYGGLCFRRSSSPIIRQ